MKLSAAAFSVAYCVAYVVALALEAPLFLYYPQTGQIVWTWQPVAGAGPAMAWYGLMTVAAAAGVVAAAAARLWKRPLHGNFLWCFPCAALLGCAYLMRPFFLR